MLLSRSGRTVASACIVSFVVFIGMLVLVSCAPCCVVFLLELCIALSRVFYAINESVKIG